MEKVSIRLIGDKESVYSIARSLDRYHKLKWTEYPAYADKARTIILEGKVTLHATAYIKKPKAKRVESSLLDFFNIQAKPEKAG